MKAAIAYTAFGFPFAVLKLVSIEYGHEISTVNANNVTHKHTPNTKRFVSIVTVLFGPLWSLMGMRSFANIFGHSRMVLPFASSRTFIPLWICYTIFSRWRML